MNAAPRKPWDPDLPADRTKGRLVEPFVGDQTTDVVLRSAPGLAAANARAAADRALVNARAELIANSTPLRGCAR